MKRAILWALSAVVLWGLLPSAGRSQNRIPEGLNLRAPLDPVKSPFTGYTRRHWIEACEKLIAGILPAFDPLSGMPVLKSTAGETGHFQLTVGPEVEARMAFERSLMLVAFYTAATGRDEIPGHTGSITAPYLNRIISGTDPGNPAYWGERPIYDAFGTNLAFAALVSPEFLWKPLTVKQKRNLLEYLEVLARTTAYDCNHWYFHLMALPLLAREGMDSHREYLTGIFKRLLGWYRGDGWFIDGGNFGFDYYNLWGFQLYNNALVHFDRDWKSEFGESVERTSRRFFETFPLLYGRDGGPIPFGRSLAYRFGSLSALAWATINGTSPLEPGQARRIASGCLKYFWERGCLSENGLLEPGYWGPNSVVAESYMDRGAPYWAVQAMAFLLIDEQNPFWSATELPMPADGSGGRRAVPGAELVLKVSPLDGEAKCIIVGAPVGHEGQWQRGIKYFQHAYSSFLGWCALGEGGPDLGAGRTGVSHNGSDWVFRTNPRPIQVDQQHCISVYDFRLNTADKEFEDFGQVVTHTLIGLDGELHVFWHNSARPLHLWLGGYGISTEEGKTSSLKTGKSVTLSSGPYHSVVHLLEAPPGDLQFQELPPRSGWRHSHLFGGRGAFPYWISSSVVEPNRPVVIYVTGSRHRAPLEPQARITASPGLLSIDFETHRFEIPLPH